MKGLGFFDSLYDNVEWIDSSWEFAFIAELNRFAELFYNRLAKLFSSSQSFLGLYLTLYFLVWYSGFTVQRNCESPGKFASLAPELGWKEVGS